MGKNMSQFGERLDGLSESGQTERYVQLAAAALHHYDLGAVVPTFIQYNGGVTYRLDDLGGKPQYLLKIAEMAGETGGIPSARIALVMEWLASLAADSPLVVQEPVASRRGELVTRVDFPDLDDPFYVTVQRWIDGEHVREAFTLDQASRVGAMIAQLHDHSSRWTPSQLQHAFAYDDVWLAECLARLSRVVDAGILTEAEWRTVEAGVGKLALIMAALGKDREVWGGIHGDLHHENLLFHGESISPIDFGDFCLGHYLHDLGVILYHVMYLDDVAVRRAIRDGYREVRPLPGAPLLWGEAFLCAAALGNLAFQVTLTSQLSSPHFARNVKEFANSFCPRLATGTPFVFD